MTQDTTPALSAGLHVESRGDEFIITCRTCGTVWAIPRRGHLASSRVVSESDRHVSKWCAPLTLVNGR
jgi:uncharacterized Zn finger protein